MSSKIDERIVGMKFNGDQFQKGVADTSKSLEKLKMALNLKDSANGLNDLDAAAKNLSLAGLADGVQAIVGKFNALSIIGITALTNIANKAIDAGLTIAKSLTIDPINAGFAEYELKMGSIQTILANTARYGTQLPEVVDNLDQLNEYADKTIYNFGDMTKNIGLFTNAGIRIEDATSMIKGFSNEAAASGTSAAGAAGAAYQLSQALSAGTVRLMDWRSLQNVGMGNKNMQNGLIEIAQAMGMFEGKTIDAQGASANFNGSLEHNWLSADVMSAYLKIMAGDMDAAAQSALGLSDAQIKSFAAQQKMSEDAATKVRTYTQLLGTLQESVGSGWSETFDILIGDFNEATDLWTAVNNELGGILGDMADARNNLLKEFVELGGRDEIIAGFANIWLAFKQYLMPITSAWKEIFPPIQAKNLLDMAKAFVEFTKSLRPSGEQMALIKRTFAGVFAVLDIGRMIVVEVVKVFMRLFGAATEGAGGILEVTANIGDFLVSVRNALKDGTALEKFFKGLGDVLQWPIDRLRELGAWTANAVGTWDLADAWAAVANAFQKIGEFLAPVWRELGNFFRDAKSTIVEFFETLDFNVLLGLLNFGALAGIGIGLKKAFDFLKGRGLMALFFGDNKDSGPGLVDKIKEVFGSVTDTFKEMQTTLKAASLIAIAVAIAMITASVAILSTIDTGQMFIALGGITVMFGQLVAMIYALDKLTKETSAPKMIGLGIALGILAGAMLIMSTAVLILSTMEWDELARGLAGMAVGLGLLVGASALLQKMSGRLIFAAPALLIIAGAMLLLSGAMKIFASMQWDELLRGGAALAVTLGVIVGAMALMHSKLFAAVSVILLAVAVNILAGAMKIFATMSWDDILRAGVAFAATMAIMVGAMALLGLMGPMVLVGSVAMIAAAAALTILAGAMKIFATMSWDEIGRGLVAMAGGLAILAGAMALMGIPLVALGGLALFVVSAGMMMLAPALKLLGSMSWDDIGRGLTMLGASLLILAAGGLLLIPASVGFLLLGAAILMLGTGAFLAGIGIGMLSVAIVALAAAGVAGAQALKMALEIMIGLIPSFMAAFAQGLIDFAMVIANGAIEFAAAATTLIQAIFQGIQNNAPLVIDTLWGLIVLLVEKVVEGVPYFVDAGLRLLTGMLDGIGNNIGKVIDSATNLIVNFLDGLGRNFPKIVQAGADLIVNFIQGLADGINNNRVRIQNAALNLADAILNGITGGLWSGIGKVIDAARGVAERALNAAKNFLGINSPSKEFFKLGSWSSEGMANGLTKTAPIVEKAAQNVGDSALTTMRKSLDQLKNAVATDMNFNPTIKPVLDLSAIKRDSGLIGGMLTPPTLKVEDGYAYALSISAAQSRDDADYDPDEGGSGTTYIFNQTNNSPKALSAAEIYRNTNNQLSVVKKGQPTNA